MSGIHQTSAIDPEAVIGTGVTIGPHSVIGKGCLIGDKTYVGPNCVLENVVLGEENQLTAGVYLGLPPQVTQKRTFNSKLQIGDRNVFREGCSVHAGLDNPTLIGSDSLFMANSHVGHDCQIANHVVLVNGALLGGHTIVEERAILSGSVVVHQFSKIGTLAIVSGLSAVDKDIVPYSIYGAHGRLARLVGANLVGLRRAGFNSETIKDIKKAIRLLKESNRSLDDVLNSILENAVTPEVENLVRFCRESKRGIARKALHFHYTDR